MQGGWLPIACIGHGTCSVIGVCSKKAADLRLVGERGSAISVNMSILRPYAERRYAILVFLQFYTSEA